MRFGENSTWNFEPLSNVASTNPADNYLVLNGDTIFKSDFNEYYRKFCAEKL